jgi:hypothetical protein
MKFGVPLATAAGFCALLTACTSSGTTTPQPSATPTTTAHAAQSIECPQLYRAWKNGPAGKVVTAVSMVAAATAGGGHQAQTAAVKNAAPEVRAAASLPMPSCADPKGYWDALLLHVNAASESLGSAGEAETMKAALQEVPQLERELNSELQRSIGSK